MTKSATTAKKFIPAAVKISEKKIKNSFQRNLLEHITFSTQITQLEPVAMAWSICIGSCFLFIINLEIEVFFLYISYKK